MTTSNPILDELRRTREALLANAGGTMSELMWLVGHQFQSLTRREFEWLFVFDKDVSVVVACLWRLVEAGRIRFTSQDDGQQFGLPAPVDAAAEVNRRLALADIESVELRQGSLDLELRFSTGQVLQIIPDSSGYEAWTLYRGKRQFIAIDGGEMAIYDDDLASG